MKNYRGKLVMAAIILSCGLVMQAEQSERAQLKQDNDGIRRSVQQGSVVPGRTVARNEDSSW